MKRKKPGKRNPLVQIKYHRRAHPIGRVMASSVIGIAVLAIAIFFRANVRTSTASGIAFAGTIYTDEGTTPLDASRAARTVNLRVNGRGQYSYTVLDVSGSWRLTDIPAGEGDVVTVALDDSSEPAATVFVSDGVGHSNVDLYVGRLIVRADTGTISNAQLATAHDGGLPYQVVRGALQLDPEIELHVWTGDTFRPGGKVSVPKDAEVHVAPAAVFDASGYAVTAEGGWNNEGTYIVGATTTDPSTADVSVFPAALGRSSVLPGITWAAQSAYALNALSGDHAIPPNRSTARAMLLDEHGNLQTWAQDVNVVVRHERLSVDYTPAALTESDLAVAQESLVETQPLYWAGEEASLKVFRQGFALSETSVPEGLNPRAPIAVEKIEVTPPPGPTVELRRVSEDFTQSSRDLEVLHLIPDETFRPGRYTVATTYTDGQTTATEESSFLWGVAAVNVRQSVVAPDTATDVHMAVLDDYGRTVCDSTVTLAVTNPDGAVQEFSTKGGSIIRNPNCRDRSVTNDPDYQAAYMTTIPGTYTMTMTATTKDGPRTITDTFAVTEPIPVTVERSEFPTRIYPPAVYPVTFQVTPLQDVKGKAIETVPIGFELSSISDNGATPDPAPDASVRTVEWSVDWQAGQTYTLKYTFDAPNISPLLFRLGPLTILRDDGSAVFSEARQWLIASDATKTWDGGGATSAWSEGANWSDNAEPVDGDDIVFDGTSNDDSDWDGSSVASSIASITASSMSGSLSVNQITTTISGAFSHTSTGNVTINQSMSVGGAFTLTTSGTLSMGTRTLTMTGVGVNINTNKTLYNLTINPSSTGTVTVVTNDFTVSNTLTVSASDTLSIGSGRIVTLSRATSTALTLSGTMSGSGTLYYSTTTAFPTAGTMSANLRMDATGGNLILSNRTYGGNVELYSNSSSAASTVTAGTAGSQTLTFSGNLTINAANSQNLTLQGATWDPTMNITGLFDFTGAGGGTEVVTAPDAAATWTVTGAVDLADGTWTASAETLKMNGTANLGGGGNTVKHLTIDGSGNTATLTGTDLTVSGTLTIGGAADGNNDTLSIATSRTLTSGTGGTVTINGSGTDTISGAGTLTVQNSNLSANGTVSSIVKFDATSGDITAPARTYDGAVTATNTGATPRTITAGAGTLAFSSTLETTSTGGSTLALELNTNDPTTTVTGALTIGSSTTFSANSANALNINGNYTNSGTFTHNSGTVTVAGSSQQTFGGTMTTTSAFNAMTITNASGSDPDTSPSVIFSTAATTAGTFTAATANTKIRFGATLVYTLTNIVFNGQATGTRVYLRSSSGGSAWLLTASGTRSVSNTNVKDSNATGSGTAIDASNGTNVDGTGNTNWTFTSGITVSGTCDQFDQTTDCTDDGSNAITVVVNGTSVGTDATVDGIWSVGSVAQPSVGDVITVFIDGNADSNEAVAVTVYSGSGNVAGIQLFQRHLVVGSDRDSTVTNANIAACDNDNGTACSGDEDVFINVTAGNDLTVDSIGSYTDEELYIDSGDTFRPASAGGADVTTVSVENVGTWTADANAINVAGDWLNSGTFTANSSTVTFNATDTGNTINAGSSSFANVTFNGSGGAWSPLTNTLTATGDLLMIAGTFDTSSGTASVTVNGNVQCSGTCGTINMTSTNTFTQSVSADKSFGTNVAVATDWTFYNLTFTGTSGVRTVTTNTTGTGEINVTNDLALSNSGTSLAVDNNTNDRILDVDNDVTIGSGATLSASSSASFTVGGSWTNSGTFTHNNGTVTLDSVAATETINPGGSSFYNVTVNNGLVGYWKLDEGTGTSSVVDSSGYGTTGTMTNLDSADWVSAGTSTYYGSDPGALNFDSSGSEYIDLGNPDQLNTGFTNKITLAARIKPTSGTGQVIIGKPHSSNSATSPYFKWILYKTSLNRLHMRIDSAFADGVSSEIVDGSWQHVAGTYDGSLGSANIKLFVNGTASNTANKTGNIQSSSINVGIGAGLFTPPNGYFNGAIDDVRVYNRALSSSEISSLASGTHPTSTTYTLQAALTVTNAFTMRTGKLDVSATNCSGSPCAVTMTGNYTNVAGLDPRTGTITFDAGATGKTIQADMPFYNLTFANASGGWTLDKQRIEADNTLTLTNGTLDVSASSCNGGGSCGVTVGANWDNDAAFTARTGTVTFDDTAGTDTIDADGTGADSFYNMTFNDAGGSATWQMTNAMDVDNNFTITGGTFDFNGSNQLNVGGNFSNSDTVTKSTGTLVMDATSGTKTIDQTGAVNGTLNNLTFNDGGGPAVFQAGSAVDVDNDLTISGGEFQAGAVKTYYLTSSTTNAVTNNRRLNTTDPAGTASDTAICGDAEVDQSNKYCVIYPTATDQTWSASLPSTIQQRGYMTDSTQPLTGTFASGTWTAAVTTSVSEFHYVYTGYEICGRLWKADTALGSATAITDWTCQSVTSALTDSTITFSSVPSVTLTNEVVTAEFAAHFIGPATEVDVDPSYMTFRVNQGGARQKITTPAFTNPISVGNNWLNSDTFTAGTGTVTFDATDTGNTINPGSSSFYNIIFNGSGGAWSPLTNTLTATNDLTMTAGTFNTAAGTASVTVNGTVQCGATCGTIEMTSAGTNTFTQSVAAAENFGTNVAVATDWSFYNLAFASTTGSPTITVNGTGTGEINVTNNLTTSTSGTALTVDNNTNDRILDVDNDVTIGANTTLSASSSAAFTVGGSWDNNGTFTHNSGTVTFDSVAASETIDAAGSAFGSLAVNNGLVGYWKMDEGTGNPADSSGYGDTGSLSGSPSYTSSTPGATYYGADPGALTLNGSSQFVDIGNPDQLNTGFTNKMTIAAYIKPDATADLEIIVGKPHNAGCSNPFFKWAIYRTANNALSMRVDSSFYDSAASTVTNGSWQHVAGVYDGSLGSNNINIYHNGTSVKTGAKTGNIQSASTNAAIGVGNCTSPGNYFDGDIDDVRIYNRALSSGELTELTAGTHATTATYTLQSALDVDANIAVRTGKLDVSATNCSSAPCAVTVAGNYTNVAGLEPRTGTVTFDGTASGKTIQADMPFYGLTFAGSGGAWTLDKQRLDVNDNLTITNGTLDASASSCSAATSCGINLAGNWSNSDTFTARTGTVTFDAGATGKTITSGGTGAGKTFYNMTFNNASGGWTVQTNSLTATNNVSLLGAAAFTVNTGLTLEVQGALVHAVDGANTTWTGSTLYLNGSGGMYDINSKTHGGDTFATLRVGASEDIAMWDSTASTVTIDSGGCLFSEDEGGTANKLYIYGTCNSRTNEYWDYATDWDGTALGGSSRQADVRFASGAALTVDSGDTLSILGQSAGANRSLITRQSSGTYAMTVNGTINAQYYDFDYLNASGLSITSTATVSELSDGSFDNAGAASASYITVNGITSTANYFRNVFDDSADGTDSSVTTNVNATGSGIDWTFFDYSGNKAGEDFDAEASGALVNWKTSLTFSVSSAGLDLGVINPNVTGSANHTLTVTTNARNGYTCRATEDGDLRDGSGNTINDVADGTVTTGAEEYGISCTGTDCQLSGDQPLSGTPLIVALRTGSASSVVTTLTYEASVSAVTAGTQYSHTVTYACTGDF